MYASLQDAERITQKSYLEVDADLNRAISEEFGKRKEEAYLAYLREFHQLQTNWLRVQFVYESMKKYKLEDVIFRNDDKNERNAYRHKKKGENCFGRGEVVTALHHFTRCIMQAKSTELLAKAYADRSACLFKLCMFPECIEDIDRALALDYPQSQRRSLDLRRSTAVGKRPEYYSLSYHETKPAFSGTSQYRRIAHVDTSKKIRTTSDDITKPGVVACKDIAIGEILCIEHPVARAVANTSELYRCHNCFNVCYNPIPCKICTQVLYCKEKCRIGAWASHHKEECRILSSVRRWVGRCRSLVLAVKMMFLRKQARFVGECTNYVDPLEPRMCTKDTANKERYLMALVTAGIFHLIKEYTPTFSANGSDYERQFVEVLYRNLRLCYVYAGGITEVKPVFDVDGQGKTFVRDMDREIVACGIYPFYLRFRHSCFPNVAVNHYGAAQVIRALRTIKAGKEIFISYGPHYYTHLQAERQEQLLKMYHFECRCKACSGDYQAIRFNAYGFGDPLLRTIITNMREGKRMDVSEALRTFTTYIKKFERNEQDVKLNFYTGALCFTFDVLANRRRL